MIYFFAEFGLMQYDLIQYCPSMVVAPSAVYVARCTLRKWADTRNFVLISPHLRAWSPREVLPLPPSFPNLFYTRI